MRLLRTIFSMMLLAFCLYGMGCSSIGTRPPEVSLVDLKVGDMTLMETTLRVVLRYRNLGNTAFRTYGASHQLSLNGIDVGTATSDRRIVIPRLGTTTEELEFHISNFGVLSRIQSIIESGALNYDIESEVYLSEGWFGKSVTSSKSGTLNDFLPLGGLGGAGRRPTRPSSGYGNRYDNNRYDSPDRPARREPVDRPNYQDDRPDYANPDYYNREPETSAYKPTGRRVPEPYQPEAGDPYGNDGSFDRREQFDRREPPRYDSYDRY
jgi:LEA14-like dessication related protein